MGVGSGVQIVLVDANVLSSRVLRDWLLQLCLETKGEMFDVRWTEDILAEAIKSIRRRHPEISGGYISNVRDKIVEILPHGRIVDFQVTGAYQGSDPLDAHVHAAAESCGANILLTENVKDFRKSGFEDLLPYEVYTADEFFVLIDDFAPHAVREVAFAQVQYYFEKHGDVDLCGPLVDAGAVAFADRVRQRLHERSTDIELLPRGPEGRITPPARR